MKIRLSYLILLAALMLTAISLSMWANPGLAQQNAAQSDCSLCHSAAEPTGSLRDCMVCHSGHEGSAPSTADPDAVHRIHASASSKIGSGRKYCLSCHKTPECGDCHNTHPALSGTNCTDCHEGLPSPKGHGNTRELLQAGKHAWMKSCLTCHSIEESKLQFSTVTTDLSNSTDLCRICHTIEYRKTVEGTHGRADSKKCVNCHEPHLANVREETGAASLQTMPDQSLPERLEKLTEGIPLLKNPLVLFVLIIILAAAASEHFLTRKERDRVVMTDLVKIEGDAGSVKALEMELASENDLQPLLATIKEKKIEILGMSMSSTSKIKLVLFLDFSKANVTQDDLLNSIKDLKAAVLYAEYTEKYEF